MIAHEHKHEHEHAPLPFLLFPSPIIFFKKNEKLQILLYDMSDDRIILQTWQDVVRDYGSRVSHFTVVSIVFNRLYYRRISLLLTITIDRVNRTISDWMVNHRKYKSQTVLEFMREINKKN